MKITRKALVALIADQTARAIELRNRANELEARNRFGDARNCRKTSATLARWAKANKAELAAM